MKRARFSLAVFVVIAPTIGEAPATTLTFVSPCECSSAWLYWPIWNVDAHRGGKRFVVRADEKLTVFLEVKGDSL